MNGNYGARFHWNKSIATLCLQFIQKSDEMIMYNNTDLQEVFTYLTKSIEVLLVLDNKKPVSRIVLNDSELENAKLFCQNNRLFFITSPTKISLDVNDKGFANKAIRNNKGKYNICYISKHESLVKRAKYADFMDDHEALGSLLGYPKCCTDFFANNFEEEIKKDNEYVFDTLKNSKQLNAMLNIVPRYFDSSFLSHFPCSFHCEASIRLANNYLETLQKHSPETAEKILMMQYYPVVLTKHEGTHMLMNSYFDGDYVHFDDVLSTTKNDLRLYLLGKGRINYNNTNLLVFR